MSPLLKKITLACVACLCFISVVVVVVFFMAWGFGYFVCENICVKIVAWSVCK